MLQDFRYAARTLRKSPGFATVAVLTLAVGIGATTTMYSVVDTILLQPLPFADSDRLVRVIEYMPHVVPGRAPLQRGVTYDEFLEWRARTRTVDDMVAVVGIQRMVRTDEGLARLWGAMVSPSACALLGTPAMLGRTLRDEDANANVIVITFETWRRLFHSDPNVVGKTLEAIAPAPAGARPLTIVGVLPSTFQFPTGPLNDFLIPVDASRRPTSVTMLGRLRPDVPVEAAMEEANVIGNAICPPRRANAPPLSIPRFEVQGLKDQIVRGLRPALRLLLAAVAVVLLIVCANVANLLLARGTARQREMAVRLAIGARRGQVVRQVLTECLVLAILGGTLGALVGAMSVELVKQLTSVDAPGIFRLVFPGSLLPRGNEVGIDLKMFGIAFSIAALTCAAFGLLPALHLSRIDLVQAMGPRGGGAGRAATRMRGALAVAQIGMATVLLVGAALLTYSFVKLSRVERGYDPSNVLAFQLLFPADYSVARKTDTIEAILARLRGRPDVRSAGFTRAGILIPEEIFVGTFVAQGQTLEEMRDDPARPRVRPVSDGFLSAIGARVLAGREFAPDDAKAPTPALVISRGVARRYFADDNPIGKIVAWQISEKLAVEAHVIGVVEDLRNESPDRDPLAEVFVSYRQLLPLLERAGADAGRQSETAIGLLSFAVRTTGDPARAAPLVAQIVREVDSNAGIDAMLPMSELVANSVARQRFYAVMLGIFAGVAGFLAAIGIYGVLAYAVIQRTQEIGIRMALGARRAQVLALVLRKGLILTTIGVALGIAGAAAGSRFLQGLLFGVTPLDTATFVAVSLMFTLVATCASYVPARRATKVDPVVALRNE